MVDVQHRNRLEAGVDERLQELLGDLLAGLGEDRAVRPVDDVLGHVLADQILVGGA